jgi:UDP-N-acetylmuramoyl-tripeptide--D-alanyl-D-alanine ligase
VTAKYELALYGSHLELMTPAGNAEVPLRIAGRHNVANACAAAACACAAGVPLAAVAAGLAAFTPYAGRMQKKVARSGAVVIDDSYNANPDSVRAAVDVLAAVEGTRVLVLGRMGEVGDKGPEFHEEVGSYARERGITCLLALGEETAPAVAGFGSGARRFESIESINAAAAEWARPGTTLLVKGSRSARMERVVASLTGETAAGAH